ncbi:protease modulator HflK [Photobacterium sp. ZSDE20]|uniref:Protease modulator HflK n=1 Tax=Photobacterium pectinilyticum TaxID=2906793 RepID=A0ABT1MYH6_9GAMM|nr:protease modulator HflK [Photobacterium sp. ZSDE20]MCQ1057562.1 protease modulator HflK [Photobacterium sp. ZSDE20]MDD1821904.1 protease modulator HflK [Photobacterium sp. ZSDE20]
MLTKDIKHTASVIKKTVLFVLLGVLPVIYVLSGIFVVNTEQRAIVTRFGRIVADNVMPGLHYRLPWPIDAVEKVATTELRTLYINYGERSRRAYLQPEMVTGNGDLIDVEYEIQYNIPSPGLYQFTTAVAEEIIERLSISETIYFISQNEFESLLISQRNALQVHVKDKLQTISDKLQLGMNINSVLIRHIDAPRNIKNTFEKLQNAPAEKQTLIERAENNRTTRIIMAQSDAANLITAARSDATETKENASGDHIRMTTKIAQIERSPMPEISMLEEYTDYVSNMLPSIDMQLVMNDEN